EVAGVEAQLGVADADDVAGAEGVLGDALAVDPGAGGALAVLDDDGVALEEDLAVDARGGRVVELGLGVLAAADQQRRAGLERERAALVGAGDDGQLRGHGWPPGAGRRRGRRALLSGL